MVFFFTSTLAVSIVGLSLLLGIKHWELATGSMLGRTFRARAHRYFSAILLWIEHIIPTVIRLYSRWAWRMSLRFIYRSTALLVLRTEKALEHTLHTLRHLTDVRHLPGRGGMGEASVFLREIAEHKKKLVRAQRTPVRVPIQNELLQK